MKKRKQYLEKLVNKVQQNFDALQLINKTNEIDKLKLLLLTPNQLRLFNLITKPVIKYEEENLQ